MSGTREVGRFCSRVNRDLNGASPIMRRDSGRNASPRVDRLAKCRPVLRSVLHAHGPDTQMFEPLLGHGQANQPAAVLGHKIDRIGGDFLGGQGKVALVLAVLVVDHNDHAAGADFLDGFWDIGEWRLGAHSQTILEHRNGTGLSLSALFAVASSNWSLSKACRSCTRLLKSITASGIRPVCFVRDAPGLYLWGVSLPPHESLESSL